MGQAEEKVDLNQVEGRQIRRDMMVLEERQHMDAYDMEYMGVEGEEEEIQVALKGHRGSEGVESPAMKGWPSFMALLGSRLRIL